MRDSNTEAAMARPTHTSQVAATMKGPAIHMPSSQPLRSRHTGVDNNKAATVMGTVKVKQPAEVDTVC